MFQETKLELSGIIPVVISYYCRYMLAIKEPTMSFHSAYPTASDLSRETDAVARLIG